MFVLANELRAAALVEYISACPPTLHLSCPHRRLEEADPTCQRECERELERLRGGLFDAGEFAARDRGQPDVGWHPVSLLRFVGEQLPTNRFLLPPTDLFGGSLSSHKRQVFVSSALAALSTFGIDLDRLVRQCLGSEIVLGTVVAACKGYSDLHREQWLPDEVRQLAERLDEMTDRPPPAPGHDIFFGALERARVCGFESRLFGWLRTANLQDIVLWNVPLTAAEWEAIPESDYDEDVEYRWLLDRLTSTYPSEWRSTSLQLEIRWQAGLVQPMVPVELLRHRQCAIDEFAVELANRVDDLDEAQAHVQQSLSEVQRTATELLRQGDHHFAASLFERALLTAPRSSRQKLKNNHAFCLLPSDPLRAQDLLIQAVADGYTSAAAFCNLGVAALALGDTDEAVKMFEVALARPTEQAVLWVPSDGGLALADGDTSEIARTLLDQLSS